MNDQSDKLSRLKITLTEILSEVDKVCEKNRIPYVLVGGTLLGAQRHGGFIPWDDDLDIAMLRSDYERFEHIAATELPDTLYFRSFHTDKEYYLPFGKVCKKGTSYITDIDSSLTSNNEVFIDVFPLDFAKKENSLFQKIQALIVKGLKSVVIRKKKMKVKSTAFSVKVMQLLCLPFSAQTLMRWQESTMKLCKEESAKYIVNLGSNYSYIKQTMPKDVYYPTSRMKFENKEFQAPANVEYYLSRIYGPNYMELPPIEKRVTHNIVKLDLGGPEDE